MQDRVSLYPGRVKLVPVSGQENTYDMVRADEPTQEGTPLSKATLLKDETAAIFGLGADAVPDDVLRVLAGRAIEQQCKVGDILVTSRNNLGENWLLCNGDTVSKTDYPELKNVMGASTKKYVSSEASSYAEFMAIGGSYIVTAGSTYIRVATSPSGPWKTYNIGKKITSLIYADGYFVVSAYDDSSNAPYISYASDPNGSWTTVQLTSNKEIACGIAYGNGKWVVAGRNSSSGNIIAWVASSPEGPWSRTVVNEGSMGLYGKNAITYADGTFVICGSSGSYGCIFVSTDLISWTEKNVWYNGECRGVKYLNGEWVAKRIYNGSGRIMAATTPLGDWTGVYSSSYFDQNIDITYYDGEYVIAGNNNSGDRIAISKSLHGSGWKYTEPNGTIIYGVMPYPDKQCWIAFGMDKINNTSYQKVIVGNAIILPEISLDRTYAYIKAKE